MQFRIFHYNEFETHRKLSYGLGIKVPAPWTMGANLAELQTMLLQWMPTQVILTAIRMMQQIQLLLYPGTLLRKFQGMKGKSQDVP